MIFTTIADVKCWYDNSGLPDWEWFEGFDENELVVSIWRNFDSCERDENGTEQFWRGSESTPVDHAIAAFLRDHGENPADYSIEEA